MIRKGLILLLSIVVFFPLIIAAGAWPAQSHSIVTVIFTSDGFKILNINPGHKSLDSFSGESYLVIPESGVGKVDCVLEGNGSGLINVRNTGLIDLGFQILTHYGQIYVGNGEALAAYTHLYYSGLFFTLSLSNTSYSNNFRIYAYGLGNYGYTPPNWSFKSKSWWKVLPFPIFRNIYPKPISKSTFSKTLIDNKTYIGWKINLSSYSSFLVLSSAANLTSTLLVNKKRSDIIFLVLGETTLSGIKKEAEIKVIVNNTGTYAFRNGVLKYHSPSKVINVLNIPGIWDGSNGMVVKQVSAFPGIWGGFSVASKVFIGDIYIKYVTQDSQIGRVVKIGTNTWAFFSKVNNTIIRMNLHPITGGTIVVKISKV